MRLKIFSSKEEDNKKCYLCESTLKEYILSLPEDYKEFDIQRGIVSNIYLDNLPNTVLLGHHMPPITLSTNEFESSGNNEVNIQNILDFKVLDGLQRTHRLKVLWDTIEFLGRVLSERELSNLDAYQITKMYSESLNEIGSDSKTFEYLLKQYREKFNFDIDSMKAQFENVQWFEIWTNLDPDDEIQKILVLNAGHKQMTTQHQIELLFLNQLKLLKEVILDEGYEFEVVRERTMSSATYSKKRKKGEYYFPHFISSTLSFIEGKPTTSNINLVKKIQYDEGTFIRLNIVINYEFIKNLTKFLVQFDDYLFNNYGELGVKWIAKDTVMTGVFAVLGTLFEMNNEQDYSSFFNRIITSFENSDIDLLNIENFNTKRNSMNISNVNIGSYTKNAVYKGIFELIDSGFVRAVNWDFYFGRGL